MRIQSFSDVITNSSSELYVFNDGKSVSEIISKLNEIAPGWENEYTTPKLLTDHHDQDVKTYIDSICDLDWLEDRERQYYCEKHNIEPVINFEYFKEYPHLDYWKLFDRNNSYASNIAKQLGLSPEEAFENWKEYDPFNTNIAYRYDNCSLQLTEKAIEIIKEFNKKVVLMWSHDENPDWDRQEKIMEIGKRYHLG